MPVANNDETDVLPDEYINAFGEDSAAPAQQTDDDAFGISTPDEEAAVAQVEGAEPGDGEAAEPAAAAEVKVEGVESQEEIAAAAEPVAAAAPESDDDDEAGMTAKEIQRRRSWEGRLRKQEEALKELAADLKAKSATTTDPDAVQAAADATPAEQAAATEIAEGLKDGTMTAEDAKKRITDDFGEEFVSMISTLVATEAAKIAGQEVTKSVTKLSEEVKQITSHIADADERAHFEAIAKAVPDFFDLTKSPEWTTYLATADDTTKRVAANGNTQEVIAMMAKFKEATKPAAKPAASAQVEEEPEEDPALAAAEGVRSGAMRLPAEPKSKDDYEGAWAEADAQA